MLKKTHRKKWNLTSLNGTEKLVNGEPFNSHMIGAYYASSLEYNFVMTPQISNAGNAFAPVEDKVKRLFKPKRPYGTFGSFFDDEEDISEYQLEAGRSLIELKNREEVNQVADSIELAASFPELKERLGKTYTTIDGRKVDYTDMLLEQKSYREGNDQIQKEIDKLIESRGYAPRFVNGKWRNKQYPQSLIDDIKALSSKKWSATGFNIKLEVFGKHTIAKNGNYYMSSASQEELDSLRKSLNYREKTNYSQGNIRVGSCIVPIQTLSQLKIVKDYFTNRIGGFLLDMWDDDIKNSHILLVKE